jgi:nucleoside-diphosphate-sugar epimerase
MSVLVTGGAGLIGGFTARKLVEREADVVIMVHKSPPTLLEARGPYENVLNKVKIAKGDITDMSFLIGTVKKYRVKRIIHTVAVMSEILEYDPRQAFRINIQGDINVLEVARLLDIERVLYTSSGRVYGLRSDLSRPAKEDDPILLPEGNLNVYAACKIFTEIAGLNYQRIYGLDFIAVRILGPYGPGRIRGPRFYPLRELVESAAKGKPFRMEREGDFKRDFNYIEDTAEACVLGCFAKKPKHRIFNISSGDPHCLFEARDIILRIIPEAVMEIGSGPPDKPLEVPVTQDISRAKEELGWELRYSFEEGIKKYVAWLQNKPDN